MSTSSHTAALDFGEPWKPFGVVGADSAKGQLMAQIVNPIVRDRVVDAINAVAGMPDPAAEIQAMREAVREAYEALKELRSFYIEMTNLPPCAANAALTKLQPFLP